MNSNVQSNLDLIRSDNPLSFENPYENWPAVTTEAWLNLVRTFLDGIAELKRIAQQSDELENTQAALQVARQQSSGVEAPVECLTPV